MKWGATRRGILSLSPTLVYCFWHSGETAESSDLQLTFTPASYKEGEQGKLEDQPGMTVAAWQQRPESRGYVRCRSADPFAAPIIQTNYLAEEIDRRVVVAGMRLARRLLASAPLAPYYEREDFPGPGVQTDDEFLAAATQRAQTTFHPGCSAAWAPPAIRWRSSTTSSRARPAGPARGRCLDHAAHDLGQSQRFDPDDRRQGLRPDPRPRRPGGRR